MEPYGIKLTKPRRTVRSMPTEKDAYYSNGLLLVKKFQDLQEGQPAPGEAEVQVYVNRGKTYIELESQGAYTTLAPGDHLDWTVSWYLMPAEGEAVPSVSLVEKVKKAIQ